MKRVLFLCIGNSCRSPMAEGFGARYGSDVLVAASAGLSPAAIIQPMTRSVMEAKNIDLDRLFPKTLQSVNPASFDLIVNMSGAKLPSNIGPEVREWPVEDPIGRNEATYIKVRDEIENRVMLLILELRRLERVAGQGSALPSVASAPDGTDQSRTAKSSRPASKTKRPQK